MLVLVLVPVEDDALSALVVGVDSTQASTPPRSTKDSLALRETVLSAPPATDWVTSELALPTGVVYQRYQPAITG